MFVDAQRAQGRLVQPRAVIKMQHIDRHVGGHGVDLINRGQAAFGKLIDRPAAHNADPLPGGRALCLGLQHAQTIGEGRHVIPAQLHREVIALADDMGVAVDQAGDHALAVQVNLFGARTSEAEDVFVRSNGRDLIPRNSNRSCLGHVLIHCGDFAVVENSVSHLGDPSSGLRGAARPRRRAGFLDAVRGQPFSKITGDQSGLMGGMCLRSRCAKLPLACTTSPPRTVSSDCSLAISASVTAK